jgi:hypothetical protein
VKGSAFGSPPQTHQHTSFDEGIASGKHLTTQAEEIPGTLADFQLLNRKITEEEMRLGKP